MTIVGISMLRIFMKSWWKYTSIREYPKFYSSYVARARTINSCTLCLVSGKEKRKTDATLIMYIHVFFIHRSLVVVLNEVRFNRASLRSSASQADCFESWHVSLALVGKLAEGYCCQVILLLFKLHARNSFQSRQFIPICIHLVLPLLSSQDLCSLLMFVAFNIA